MSSPLQSLIGTGTRLWLDSIDPELIAVNRRLGATGATSNPIIIADLIQTGRFDRQIEELFEQGTDDEQVAWTMTDRLVQAAQEVFLPVWRETSGDDGYVSFELDPLLEDPQLDLPHLQRVSQYVELAKYWSSVEGDRAGNRMIKIPATPAGLDALEEVVAAGVTVNVTLIFSQRQYRQAREAVWRGAQRRDAARPLKSVYSIFVSRIDVYTEQHAGSLSPAAQGQVGIVNAKRIWGENQRFWQEKQLPLAQQIVFASTGTKKPDDPPWKYAEALAGGDIQTNPPATNQAIAESGRTFDRQVDQLPPADVLAEIDAQVDFEHMEATLMREGVEKFANPHKALLALIGEKRAALAKR